MSVSPLNPTKHLQRQGIDPKMIYAAVVVDHDDPRKAGRVRVRIKDIHVDAIPDKALPWALPMNQDYATNGDTVERSGTVSIPLKGSKVGVQFKTGDQYKPSLAPYPGDKKTILPEAEKNYPYRKVIRESNGFYAIIDRKSNEFLMLNPGDMHLVLLGDFSQTIIGSHTQTIGKAKGDIPGYLLNASDTKIQEIQAKSAGGVSAGAGNQKIHIKGNQEVIIEGTRTVTVKGSDTLTVQGSRTEKISGEHIIDSARSETN